MLFYFESPPLPPSQMESDGLHQLEDGIDSDNVDTEKMMLQRSMLSSVMTCTHDPVTSHPPLSHDILISVLAATSTGVPLSSSHQLILTSQSL